jgi:hypothetical protein
MPRKLRVYNQFDELILHLEHAQGDPSPLRILEGTTDLCNAVKALERLDFDRTAMARGELLHFTAKWDSPDFLAALGGYWSSNFGWRTKLTEMAPSFAFVFPPNVAVQNVIVSHQYQPMFSSLLDYRSSQIRSLSGGLAEYVTAMGTAKFIGAAFPEAKHPQLDIRFEGISRETKELTPGTPGWIHAAYAKSQAFQIADALPGTSARSFTVGSAGWVVGSYIAGTSSYEPMKINPSVEFASELFSESAFAANEQFAIAEVNEKLWLEKPRLLTLLPEAA